jgi:hypothetical protein
MERELGVVLFERSAQGIVKGGAMKDWMKIIPEAELRTYKRGGFQTDLAAGSEIIDAFRVRDAG